MTRANRDKGRRAECEAGKVLMERDWQIIKTSSGLKTEDIIATSPEGVTHSVEVKNHKEIRIPYFLAQAKEQAKKRKMPYLLMIRIPATGNGPEWLVMRAGQKSVIWGSV